MSKRLGGSLLGFGVKSEGEFCMSYECAARRGARVRDLLTLTHPRTKLGCRFMKFKQIA
jgi:hypothetical protein